MKFEEYQRASATFAQENIKESLPYLGLGLTGEAGEVAEKLKKYIRDGVIVEKDVAKELGDVLWYVSQLASYWNIPLEDVARGNLEKLGSRQTRGKIGGSGDDR